MLYSNGHTTPSLPAAAASVVDAYGAEQFSYVYGKLKANLLSVLDQPRCVHLQPAVNGQPWAACAGLQHKASSAGDVSRWRMWYHFDKDSLSRP
jgi:hypothetical protein